MDTEHEGSKSEITGATENETMTFAVLLPVLSISKIHYANKETYLSVVQNFYKKQLVKNTANNLQTLTP